MDAAINEVANDTFFSVCDQRDGSSFLKNGGTGSTRSALQELISRPTDTDASLLTLSVEDLTFWWVGLSSRRHGFPTAHGQFCGGSAAPPGDFDARGAPVPPFRILCRERQPYEAFCVRQIRLPQESSKMAYLTSSISCGSPRKTTPSVFIFSISRSNSSVSNWAAGMPASKSAL